MGITCFAADGTSSEGVETFNTVVEFIVDWVARIGLVIGFIGAVQFAMGFKDDSADGKTRGLMWLHRICCCKGLRYVHGISLLGKFPAFAGGVPIISAKGADRDND